MADLLQFSRAWVIQEALLARDVTLLFGARELEAMTLNRIQCALCWVYEVDGLYNSELQILVETRSPRAEVARSGTSCSNAAVMSKIEES